MQVGLPICQIMALIMQWQQQSSRSSTSTNLCAKDSLKFSDFLFFPVFFCFPFSSFVLPLPRSVALLPDCLVELKSRDELQTRCTQKMYKIVSRTKEASRSQSDLNKKNIFLRVCYGMCCTRGERGNLEVLTARSSTRSLFLTACQSNSGQWER